MVQGALKELPVEGGRRGKRHMLLNSANTN